MVTERKKYPIRAEDYETYEDIGQGVTATVYRARCIPFNEIVAIKILDLEKTNNDLSNISREAQTMILINHPNLLNAHCSFGNDKTLWVVMPYMGGGSCLHMLQSAYPEGFEEVVIATVLREVLSGLEYLHSHGHIHRDVKAGNILLDASSGIKLGDFGVSASLFDSGHRQRMRNTFVGTPCWMAPEVMEQLNGYDFKADIWSFGITALELAHGHAPFSKYPPIKVLLMTLQNAPPSLENDKKFSRAFKQMVARCLVKDPSQRPTAHKLLKHNFFKQARSNDYIARTLLEGLPPLGDRIKALKEKEQHMLAQKKMPDVKKEELSQSEYKRGISGWNFDLDDLRIQAALVQDEDFACDKETCGSGNSTVELGSTHMRKCASASSSCSSNDLDKEYIEINQIMQGKQSTIISYQLPVNQRLKSDGADNGASLKSSSSQNALHGGSHHRNHSETGTNSTVVSASETNGKHVESDSSDAANGTKGTTSRSASLDAAQTLPKEESALHRSQLNNCENGSATIPPTADGVVSSDVISKASKTSAISEDTTDAKSKVPVVQQKGRFKVTSENMELEKVPPPSLGITKCLSLQAISQASALNLPSPIGPRSHLPGSAAFQHLLYFLQDNINKREYILNAMKQLTPADLSANQSTDASTSQSSTNLTEKSLIMHLEAAHDKEKELMQQVTDLQSRFSSGQEEPQRLKPRNLSRITSFSGV